jgi:hypothetical protein
MPVDVGLAENLSNLTWLVFAGASIFLWRRKILPALGDRWGRSLFALAGVLLLMFPVISLSDDLHPDLVIAAEGEGKSKRLLAANGHAPNSHSSPAAQLAEGVARLECPPALLVEARLFPTDSILILHHVARSPRGRAPPLSPLA